MLPASSWPKSQLQLPGQEWEAAGPGQLPRAASCFPLHFSSPVHLPFPDFPGIGHKVTVFSLSWLHHHPLPPTPGSGAVSRGLRVDESHTCAPTGGSDLSELLFLHL